MPQDQIRKRKRQLLTKSHIGDSKFYMVSSPTRDPLAPRSKCRTTNGTGVFLEVNGGSRNELKLHDIAHLRVTTGMGDVSMLAILHVKTWQGKTYVVNVGFKSRMFLDEMDMIEGGCHWVKINGVEHPPYEISIDNKFNLSRVIPFLDILMPKE